MSFFRTGARLLFSSLALAVLALAGTARFSPAQVPLKSHDTTLRQMIEAIQSKSYAKFVAEGDERFKTGFTEKMFDDLARQIGPRLQQGYSPTFLTTLNQLGYVVYVWKFTFKDGKDDLLITLFMKDGSVSGLVTR